MSLIRFINYSSRYVVERKYVTEDVKGVTDIIDSVVVFFEGWPQDVVVFEMMQRMILKEMGRYFMIHEGMVTVREYEKLLKIDVQWFYKDGKNKFPMLYDDKVTLRFPK